MKEYVLGFAFDARLSTVLLIQKTKPEWQCGKLNGVGGKIEEGETPLQAMEREFEEETRFKGFDWIPFGEMKGKELDGSPWIIYLFTCKSFKYLPVGYISPTKERVVEENVICESSFDKRYARVWNLCWLLPMAINKLKRNEKFYLKIEEVHEAKDN